MKLNIEIKTDLFDKITVTIANKSIFYSAECFNNEIAREYIIAKLTKIAGDTVLKMYDQKAYFFNMAYIRENQLNAFAALKEAIKNPMTLDEIQSYILPILSDLKPAKTAAHYNSFNGRFEWLFSLLYNSDINLNASEIRQKYLSEIANKDLSEF